MLWLVYKGRIQQPQPFFNDVSVFTLRNSLSLELNDILPWARNTAQRIFVFRDSSIFWSFRIFKQIRTTTTSNSQAEFLSKGN